tara:strand:- start:1113 stop:1277 length:165 start_codon:yes stop_codon:yes gene_type:complete
MFESTGTFGTGEAHLLYGFVELGGVEPPFIFPVDFPTEEMLNPLAPRINYKAFP